MLKFAGREEFYSSGFPCYKTCMILRYVTVCCLSSLPGEKRIGAKMFIVVSICTPWIFKREVAAVGLFRCTSVQFKVGLHRV